MRAGKDIRVALLGSIEATVGDKTVPIVGTKLQALLSLLALAAPEAVSTDRLIEEIWRGDPPSKPVNALQAQVSQLRRSLGSEAVVREGAGYALAIDSGAIDANRLEELVHLGRAAMTDADFSAASDHFRSAIALVRGPPLVELADHAFSLEAAARIDQLVLAAQEGDVDAHLALGLHSHVLEQLQALVAHHPLRERFHTQLITALYRSGRQADALAAYQDVRDVLLEELGLDPGPELQALERAVLSHDPALAAPLSLATGRSAPILPLALTSFVGREAELAQLDDAVARSRLVTLVGPGGVGKTRLVLELARRRAPASEVWFVELAPVADPIAVPEALASTLGANDHSPTEDPTSARSPVMRSVDRVGDRAVTIVLDNCEHVADVTADLVETLLATCPGLTVVATSREPLRIRGEIQIPVAPLRESEAAQLFTERAQAVQPSFGKDAADDDIVQLCRRLDGLPLAIELAAARAKSLPIPEITSRLDDRFQLLRSTGRSGDERHRELGATIDWSYEMLFEDERRAFRRLALFAGGVTIDTAKVFCGDDALDVLDRLVDRSLLIADATGTESRFRMLESLRAYGMARLEEAGELEEVIATYLAWCLDLAHRAERPVRGAEQIAWLDHLDAEHDNLRAGFTHAVTFDRVAGLRLIGALVLPWWFRGRRQEARHWAETFIEAAPDAPPADMAKALAWCGFIAESSGWTGTPGGMEQELELAERRQRRALELAEHAGDDVVAADVRMLLLATMTRRTVAGLPISDEEFAELTTVAIEGYQGLGDDYGAGIVRLTESITALAAGDLHHAAVANEAAHTHAQRSGDRFAMGRVEWMLGMLDDVNGDARGAHRHIERSLRLLDELGMAQAVTAQAGMLIPLADRAGMPELANQWRAYVEGRAPGSARDDVLTIASARNGEALRARAEGDFDRAHHAHLEALGWYDEASVSGGTAFTRSCLGFLASAMGDTDAAVLHHREALEAAATANEPAALALALEGAASVTADRDPARAGTLLGAARALWTMASAASNRTHRDDVDRVAQAVIASLGEPAYDAAIRDGLALDRSELIASGRAALLPRS